MSMDQETPLPEAPQRGLGTKAPALNWRDPRDWLGNMVKLLKGLTPQGLLPRALIIIVAPIMLLQLMMVIIFFDRHWDRVTARLTRAVAGDVAAMADIYDNNPAGILRARQIARAESLFAITVSRSATETLPPPAPPPWYHFNLLYEIFNKEMATTLEERRYFLDLDSVPKFADVRVELKDGAIMRVLVPWRRISSSTAYIYILWMAGLSIFLLTIAILFLRNQIRPITQLAKAADHFGRGMNVPGFKPSGASEVRAAARSFIAMRKRLERQIANRTAMLSGVSHDLRTPLTRLRLELALIDDNATAKAMQDDLAEMERMLNAYLAFAKGLEADPAQEIETGKLAQDVVTPLQRGGRDVTLTITESVTMKARPLGLARALTNLIENGCRYGSKVAVTVQTTGRFAEFIVDDDGPGIPPDQREEMFRPFTRAEESRNQKTGGVGLGLAIARDMANLHGGDIALGEAPMGGLRAVLRLPYAPLKI
ncbi:MAG: ATP-binding protein [Alphaproteobacteria bacterium]